MFNSNVIYDEEIYNHFNHNENIKEDEDIGVSGDNLINAIKLQENYYKVSLFCFLLFLILSLKDMEEDFDSED